jgi:hypothetical protein
MSGQVVSRASVAPKPRTLSLGEILETTDTQTRCWWGIFAGVGRCPNAATHQKKASGREQAGHQNGLLIHARWCKAHAHSDDRPITED